MANTKKILYFKCALACIKKGKIVQNRIQNGRQISTVLLIKPKPEWENKIVRSHLIYDSILIKVCGLKFNVHPNLKTF